MKRKNYFPILEMAIKCACPMVCAIEPMPSAKNPEYVEVILRDENTSFFRVDVKNSTPLEILWDVAQATCQETC